ncbi:MAG: hypothetical protein V4644_02770 [Patescibacteria group bacterium]
MHYYFDFDRTVFDTPAFKAVVKKRPTMRELFHQFHLLLDEVFSKERSLTLRRIFARVFGTYASHQRIGFTPAEVKGFLYPDAAAFLTKHAKESTIVTYGVRAFITAKVANALTDVPLNDIVYTSRKKGRTIRRLITGQEGPFVFVDDAHFQLESVGRACPEVQLVEVRRDGQQGDGRWPVIRSFDELEKEGFITR